MRIIVFAILALAAISSSASVANLAPTESARNQFVRIVLGGGQEMSDAQKGLLRSYIESCNAQVVAVSPEIAEILSVDSQTARFVISIIGVTCASEAFRNIKQLGDTTSP